MNKVRVRVRVRVRAQFIQSLREARVYCLTQNEGYG